jgi:Mn2+/Fe2+ NRAMP family transporter
MIAFLIVCAILGIFLAFLLAPLLIIANKKKLREMDEVVAAFHNLSAHECETKRDDFRRRLASIKAQIFAGDKQAIEAARDKMTLI